MYALTHLSPLQFFSGRLWGCDGHKRVQEGHLEDVRRAWQAGGRGMVSRGVPGGEAWRAERRRGRGRRGGGAAALIGQMALPLPGAALGAWAVLLGPALPAAAAPQAHLLQATLGQPEGRLHLG